MENEKRPDLPVIVVEKLLSECRADYRYQGVRDAAVIALLYSCGLRRAESVAVDYDCIDQVEWFLSVVTKENKLVRKWIAPELLTYVQKWIQLRNGHIPPEGPLFTRIRKGKKVSEGIYTPGEITEHGLTPQAIYYILEGRAASAGVTVNSRDLRSMYLINSVKLRGVVGTQLFADHIDAESTARYIRINESEMREAIKASSPD